MPLPCQPRHFDCQLHNTGCALNFACIILTYLLPFFLRISSFFGCATSFVSFDSVFSPTRCPSAHSPKGESVAHLNSCTHTFSWQIAEWKTEVSIRYPCYAFTPEPR